MPVEQSSLRASALLTLQLRSFQFDYSPTSLALNMDSMLLRRERSWLDVQPGGECGHVRPILSDILPEGRTHNNT